jgi:predicted MPP superfamily phosphohydrolase
MQITIVHLSDLHIKERNEQIKSRVDRIAEAICCQDIESDIIIIAFSGDIAYSGLDAQYTLAKDYISTLINAIRSKIKNKPIHFFATPGNHDCDFDNANNQTREFLINGLLKSPNVPLEEGTLQQCVSHQANFFKFLRDNETIAPISNEGNFHWRYEINVAEKKITVSCFNTALSSHKHEQAGSLFIPTENLKGIKAPKGGDYSIAIFHHPYNWLTPDAKAQFLALNEKNSDLILTGHEHLPAHYRKSNYASGSSAYIEGAVLASHDLANESGFNLITVNLDACEELIREYAWDGELFSKSDISGGWRPYRKALKSRDFELTSSMATHIAKTGVPFTHPAKPNLSIDDIFIAPDAEELSIKPQKGPERTGIIKGKNLLPSIIDRKKAFVIGRERAGKSTLAKLLFQAYYSNGYTPVLIEGHNLKRGDIESVTKVVRRHIELHYENPKLELFDQYDIDKIAVIIDDLDHANELGPKGRSKLIEQMAAKYPRVVIFGDDLLRIEEIASRQFNPATLGAFAHFELKEFGYVLRSQLIDKWYALNADYTFDEEALQRKVQSAEQLIDDMMRRSYLPSYPIFILTILQGSDTQSLHSNVGSYGYLYQVLITDKLVNFAKNITLERKLGYLVELAYYMFKQRHTELSDVEYELFHRRYCAEYPPIERSQIFEALEAAGILEIYDNHYRFKYQYFYYYFVAQYFSRHIDEDQIRTEIKGLCKDFDKEEHANIWLFLTHQSRSQFLLDAVVDYAQHFFTDLTPLRLDGDVKFLDELFEKVPSLIYVDKSISQIRQERRERLDRDGFKDEALEPIATPAQQDAPPDILELIKQLKAAIRTLDVIGQIVKNFASSMRSDPRYILVKECYDLGLRVIARCVKMWNEAGDEFIGDILDVILEKNTSVETKEELEKAIKGFIFFFCETITVNMIKRVAQAVGSRELIDTYAKLMENQPSRAYEMIDLALKLDNPSFPSAAVFGLKEKVSKEIFCQRILSRLVVGHFYLYNTKDQLKQQVCNKLGIQIQKFQEIDFRTSESKRL